MNHHEGEAWAHLPNAKLIDRIIADVQARPEAWAAAWDAARAAERLAALDAAWALSAPAALIPALDAAGDAERHAAWDAILALIAWDDCALLLDANPEHVQVLALLGHQPAVLLLPAAIALNKSMTYST